MRSSGRSGLRRTWRLHGWVLAALLGAHVVLLVGGAFASGSTEEAHRLLATSHGKTVRASRGDYCEYRQTGPTTGVRTCAKFLYPLGGEPLPVDPGGTVDVETGVTPKTLEATWRTRVGRRELEARPADSSGRRWTIAIPNEAVGDSRLGVFMTYQGFESAPDDSDVDFEVNVEQHDHPATRVVAASAKPRAARSRAVTVRVTGIDPGRSILKAEVRFGDGSSRRSSSRCRREFNRYEPKAGTARSFRFRHRYREPRRYRLRIRVFSADCDTFPTVLAASRFVTRTIVLRVRG